MGKVNATYNTAVIRVYGTYLGNRALAWVGFADRFDWEFVNLGDFCYRRISDPLSGWDQRYYIEDSHQIPVAKLKAPKYGD